MISASTFIKPARTMLLEFIVNVGRTRIDGKKEALNDTVY